LSNVGVQEINNSKGGGIVRTDKYCLSIQFLLIIAFLIMTVLDASPMGAKQNPPNLQGSIFINIKSGKKFYEYRVNPVTGAVENTLIGDRKYFQDSGTTISIEESDAFLNAWMDAKYGQSLPLEKAMDYFSNDEMLSITALFSFTIRGQYQSGTILPVAAVKDDNVRREAIQSLEYRIFYPNKSYAYAIIASKPVSFELGSGMIVDIAKKEAYSPFHGNKVRMFEWSPNGKFVAYSVDHSRWIPSEGKYLVIYDVENRKIVLEKGLGDYIASMAWSPDSDHIAVLIKDTRIFTVDPTEQMLLLSGHPERHDSFSMKIFDRKREIKSIGAFGKAMNTRAIILWQ
jgi:hypothetical protein